MKEEDRIETQVNNNSDDEDSEDDDDSIIKWKRKYTADHILQFLEMYFEILDQVLEIPPEHKVAYIMEKSTPIYAEDKKIMKKMVFILLCHILYQVTHLYFTPEIPF